MPDPTKHKYQLPKLPPFLSLQDLRVMADKLEHEDSDHPQGEAFATWLNQMADLYQQDDLA